MISGEANKIIKDSKSGLVGEAEDYNSLEKNIIKLINTKKNKLNKYGLCGLDYANSKFKKKTILNNLLLKIKKL